MTKFLVTGGAGFIGSHIVEALLKQGHWVRVVDNFSTGKKENIQPFLDKIEFLRGDLSNLKTAQRAVKNIDIVFHQAAIPSVQRSVADPLSTNSANINGTLNILLAARDAKVKKIIYASSSSIYGNTPVLPKKETAPVDPISSYTLTKFAGERYCQLFHRLYGLPTVCLRYFNVFGPRQNPKSQYSAAIPKFIMAILNDQSPVIYGDGEQSRDFTYVDNVVKANLLAATSEIVGEVINIACGKRITLNQVVALINKALGKEIKPVFLPPKIGDIQHSLADITKAQELLNYQSITGFEEGLKKTIEWCKLHHK